MKNFPYVGRVFEKYSKTLRVGVYFLNNICYNNVEKGRIIMKICKLWITTAVDGQESKLHRMGKLEIEEERVLLQYKEEGAQVALSVGNGCALVERQGDYTLRLPLLQGQSTVGCLGIGGSEGRIPVEADFIRYTRQADGVEIHLRYRLAFGEDAQEMRLHIQAKTRG